MNLDDPINAKPRYGDRAIMESENIALPFDICVAKRGRDCSQAEGMSLIIPAARARGRAGNSTNVCTSFAPNQ